jgi:hypothetical protein
MTSTKPVADLTAKGVEWAGPVRKLEHPVAWYRFRPLYGPEGNVLNVTEPHVNTERRVD